MDRSSKRNPLTAVLFELRPPGFQIEARHNDEWPMTEYRFTRLSDGVWCQQAVSDEVVVSARDVREVARYVLDEVQRKFAEHAYQT